MTYAVVQSGGMQFKVSEGEVVRVPKLTEKVGSTVELPEVLLLGGEKTLIGRPLVAGARVTAKILAHGKADKIVVFKFRRRKDYRRTRGHRQQYTDLLVTRVIAPGSGS